MITILVMGLVGLGSMRSTFFPENESKIISVRVVYPGASPEEVEEGVVNKIEDNIEGITGIDRISSVSSENLGSINVEAARGYDIDEVLRDVKNAIDGISSFPQGIEQPVIYKLETLNIALQFAVSGNVDLRTLKDYARKIEDDLLAMEGLSKVEVSGFPDEEIEIAIRENDLRTYNLTFDQVALAVSAANLDITGGTIKGENEEVLIRTRSKKYYGQELENIKVATSPDGRDVTLGEIAEIRDQWADDPNRSYLNGKPAVRINVQNTVEESLLGIADSVATYVERFNASHEDVSATIIQDGSEILRQRISLLVNNGVVGFILVVIILTLFLRPSLAFWVAVAIPVSFAGVFLVGSMIGLQVNVLSLFGLILVLGILVDDGIVISENIYSHFERGKPAFQAAVDGTMEVLPAVLGAILTTMTAFGLFFFLDGITGDFFVDLAIVVIISLGFSLIEGAFILPGHISHSAALRDHDEGEEPNRIQRFFTEIQDSLTRFMDWLREKFYAPQLRTVMKYPILGLTIPAAVLILTMGLPASGKVSVTFFPVIEGDNSVVTLKMPAGTTEETTKSYLDRIEQGIWKVNEELKTERPDGKDVILIVNQNLGPSTYEGSILIGMLDSETRQLYGPHASSLGILNRIEKKVGKINESEQLTYTLGSPFGKAIDIALFGDDLSDLKAAVREVRDSLSLVAELINVESSDQEGLREINLKLNEKGRLLGLTLQQVIGQVRQGFFGAEVQRLQRGEDEVKVWVRYDEEDRTSISQLENMYIRTNQGQTIPLKEIATLEMGRGLITINHLDRKREIRIQADAANAKVSTQDVLARIQTIILPEVLEKYPTVSVSFEGQSRENDKFANSIFQVGPLVVFIMVLLIILTFRSISQTFALLGVIPFAFIGVFWGHYLFDKPFSIILSGLGVLALIGILVNDGLVLISQYNILVKEGKNYREALYEAALSRFRPIFLTSLTTIAGLSPLILEKSLQAQFLIPMAITIAFGLAVATLLILVSLPSFLLMGNAIKSGLVALSTGQWPDRNSLEPASDKGGNYMILNALKATLVIVLLVRIGMAVF